MIVPLAVWKQILARDLTWQHVADQAELCVDPSPPPGRVVRVER